MADARIAHALAHAATQSDADAHLAHALVLAATPIRATGEIAHLLVFVATTPDPCETPPAGEDLSEAGNPLLWVNYDLGNGLGGVGEVLLDDPATYYGGRKLPRLTSVSEVRRALPVHAAITRWGGGGRGWRIDPVCARPWPPILVSIFRGAKAGCAWSARSVGGRS
jgi:hypothetical protein